MYIYICILYYIHFFLQRSPQVPSESLRSRLEATIRPGEMSSPKFTAETAQFRSQDAVNWSTEIPITEDVAGPWPSLGHGKRWVKSMGKSRENMGHIVEICRNTGKCWSSKSWKAKRCMYSHFSSILEVNMFSQRCEWIWRHCIDFRREFLLYAGHSYRERRHFHPASPGEPFVGIVSGTAAGPSITTSKRIVNT